MKKLVYIAGPYSSAPMPNTRKAILAADRVLDAGYVPVVPHLTAFWDVISPKPYETWLEIDIEQLRRCDALLRIPGESSGADREVEFAKEHGIPVFVGLLDFLRRRREVLGG